MANTKMIAKNTFAEGLIMDFAPDNTQANVLTSALNATLLTFNGNELSLQNDMGNGRVETARLPDGYVPVGTCEFGDIIYIVSYNPLLNKSQIGCFPSPERNVSSEEIGGTNSQILATDFLEFSGGVPTGKLIADDKKYILYQKSLNPGDKYIIYNKGTSIATNQATVSEIGNEKHVFGNMPRLLTLHVVSIEDSGKINFLDSTVKWYDTPAFYILNDMTKNNYNAATGKIDLDSYRSMLDSGYSIFQSKISGKLAILAELEKISGFSCTYGVYSNEDTIKPVRGTGTESKKYKVGFDFSWDTDNENINPKYIVLTKSEWKNNNPIKVGTNKTFSPDPTVNKPAVLTAWNDTNPDCWHATISDFVTDFYKNTSWSSYKSNCYTTRAESWAATNKDITKIILDTDSKGIPNPGHYLLVNKDKGILYKNNTYMTQEATPTNINSSTLYDTLVNNYFHQSVYKNFWDVTLPITYTHVEDDVKTVYPYDKSSLIYHYQMAPAMPYGILQEYAVDGYIDFSKVGTGEININKWKYYITLNTATLQLGLDVYPEPNKGVSEVVLEFYDNQGFAAAYHITGRKSYSGTFTEVIPLNGSTSTHKLNAIDAKGTKHQHAGLPADEASYNYDDVNYVETTTVTVDKETGEETETVSYAMNDAGNLYFGVVYLVKIVVKYQYKNALGEFKEETGEDAYADTTYYRWMWTNLLYNDRYYDTADYEYLPFELSLDSSLVYELGKGYKYNTFAYEPTSLSNNTSENLSAIVLQITGNINLKVYPTLLNGYGSILINDTIVNEVPVKVFDGNTYIQNTPGVVEVKHSGSEYSAELDAIQPVLLDGTKTDNIVTLDATRTELDLPYGVKLCELLNIEAEEGSEDKELWMNQYKLYKNDGFITTNASSTYTNDVDYVTYLRDYKSLKDLKYSTISYSTIENECPQLINVNLIHFSKYYQECKDVIETLSIFKPLLRTTLELENYGLSLEEVDGKNHVFIDTLTAYHNYYTSSHHSQLQLYTWDLTNQLSFSLSNPNNTIEEHREDLDGDGPRKGFISMFDDNITNTDIYRLGSYKEAFKGSYNGELSNMKGKFALMTWKDNDWWIFTNSKKQTNFNLQEKLISKFTDYLTLNNITYYPYSNFSNMSLNEDASTTPNGKVLTFLSYFGDSKGQLHIFNTAFVLPVTGGNIKQNVKLLTYQQSTTPTRYYKDNGYDYYYIVMYGDNIDGSYKDEWYITAKKITEQKDIDEFNNTYKSETLRPSTVIVECNSGSTFEIVYNLNNSEYTLLLSDVLNKIHTTNKDFGIPGPMEISGARIITTTYYLHSGDSGTYFKLADSEYPTVTKEFDTYAGDLVASMLQSIYVSTGQELTILSEPVDTAFLSDNNTLYTKEIICLPDINNDDDYSGCIALGLDILFNKYLEKIYANSGISEDSINKSNVTLKLKSCIKTFPLLLQLNYQKPSITKYTLVINAKIYLADGTYKLSAVSNIDSDKLYEYSNGTIKLLSAGHVCPYASEYKVTTNNFNENILLGVSSEYSSSPNTYIKNYIEYDGELTLTKDEFEGTRVNSLYFGFGSNHDYDGKTNTDGVFTGMCDNIKKEVFLSDLQVIKA